jgi:hypothetical protein
MARNPVVRKASRHAYEERNKVRRLAESKAYKAETRPARVAANSLLYYGITPDETAALSDRQSGLCKICGLKKKLCIDHDHATGKVRALLCGTCNTGLGMFKDSLGLLRTAGQYLLDH